MSVRRIHKKKIIGRRRIRKSHIHRLCPVVILVRPFRHIYIIAANAVKALRGEVERPAVRRKHRIYFICRREHMLIKEGRDAPKGVLQFSHIYITYTFVIRSTIEYAFRSFRSIRCLMKRVGKALTCKI